MTKKLTSNRNFFINNELLVRSLAAMPNHLTLDEFQELCDITSRITTRELVEYLVNQGIGHMSDGSVMFSGKDKLDTILLAIRNGCDPERLSKKIQWKDFELFTSQLIELVGYPFERNVVLTNPRIQIDVIGFYHKIALLIDCKHWMKIQGFDIAKFSSNQITRAEIFLDKRKDIESAIPIIVTLYEHNCNFFDRVPIVSISKFKEFLQNFALYLDRLHLIEKI
ncbi:MAG TPA: hypothetical protein VJ772_09040 [Nitrososphaeraceae archaeon]|nr:hypothetical protein [Nitrososphaeraceae archaeon]